MFSTSVSYIFIMLTSGHFNATSSMKQEIRGGFDIHTEALAEKYLGLPTAIGRSTKEVFEYMPSRIRGFIWGNENNLSSAGKEILIKSVAQGVPTYPMSCFKLASETCKK